MSTDKHFLSPKQLAKRWNSSAQTLANKRNNGRSIPYVKIGNRVLYDLKVIEAYEVASVRSSTSDQGGVK